jgi:hypothetical protein
MMEKEEATNPRSAVAPRENRLRSLSQNPEPVHPQHPKARKQERLCPLSSNGHSSPLSQPENNNHQFSPTHNPIPRIFDRM